MSKLLQKFLQFMPAKGYNLTEQRSFIAEEFFALPGHHTLEEVYARINRKNPKIGQTTVYRTLKLLCEAGLAHEIHIGDGIAKYEVAYPGQHHDHIMCVECGTIIELSNKTIEDLQKQMADQHGFILTGHTHNLYGICQQCHKKSEKEHSL